MRRVALLLPPAACGPVSVAQAERSCMEDAPLAQTPRGEVGIGIGSGGNVRAGGEITITTDYILGRDPSEVFDRCVMRRSGQMPVTPYAQQPAYRG